VSSCRCEGRLAAGLRVARAPAPAGARVEALGRARQPAAGPAPWQQSPRVHLWRPAFPMRRADRPIGFVFAIIQSERLGPWARTFDQLPAAARGAPPSKVPTPHLHADDGLVHRGLQEAEVFYVEEPQQRGGGVDGGVWFGKAASMVLARRACARACGMCMRVCVQTASSRLRACVCVCMCRHMFACTLGPIAASGGAVGPRPHLPSRTPGAASAGPPAPAQSAPPRPSAQAARCPSVPPTPPAGTRGWGRIWGLGP
jgi:hypothetical protein